MTLVTILFENGASLEVDATPAVGQRLSAQFGRQLSGEEAQNSYRINQENGDTRFILDMEKVVAVVAKSTG